MVDSAHITAQSRHTADVLVFTDLVTLRTEVLSRAVDSITFTDVASFIYTRFNPFKPRPGLVIITQGNKSTLLAIPYQKVDVPTYPVVVTVLTYPQVVTVKTYPKKVTILPEETEALIVITRPQNAGLVYVTPSSSGITVIS